VSNAPLYPVKHIHKTHLSLSMSTSVMKHTTRSLHH